MGVRGFEYGLLNGSAFAGHIPFSCQYGIFYPRVSMDFFKLLMRGHGQTETSLVGWRNHLS
jgi:hypothetical protein